MKISMVPIRSYDFAGETYYSELLSRPAISENVCERKSAIILSRENKQDFLALRSVLIFYGLFGTWDAIGVTNYCTGCSCLWNTIFLSLG